MMTASGKGSQVTKSLKRSKEQNSVNVERGGVGDSNALKTQPTRLGGKRNETHRATICELVCE